MKRPGKYERRMKIYAGYLSAIEGAPYVFAITRMASRRSERPEWYIFFRRKDDENGYARTVGRGIDKDLAYKMLFDYEFRHCVYCKTCSWEEIEIKATAAGVGI